MTRLSMIDSANQMATDDEQLMKLPYKCSQRERHVQVSRKQHHHDGRRRKERHRQRRRMQRREKRLAGAQGGVGRQRGNQSSEEDNSDRGEKHREEAMRRRNRWREMEEKKAGQVKLVHYQYTPPEDVEPQTDNMSATATHMHITDYVEPEPSSKKAPETYQRVNAKTKAKISINLNFGGAMAALNKSDINDKCRSADDVAYSLVDGVPYPAIEDQRDIEAIHRALLSRKRDIELKLNDVVYQLNIQAETQPDDAGEIKLHEQADILRAQIRRMDTQLDYVQTRIEVENAKSLSRRKSQKEKEECKRQITSLVNRMGRLHHTMKEANRQYNQGLAREGADEAKSGSNQQGNDVSATEQSQKGLSAIHSRITDLLQQKGTSKGWRAGSSLSAIAGDKRKNKKAGAQQKHASLQAVQERQKQHEQLMSMLKADGELNSQVCRQIDSFVQDEETNPVLRALGVEAKKRLGANEILPVDEQSSPAKAESECELRTTAADVDEREFAKPVVSEPASFTAPPILRDLISSGVPVQNMAPPPIVFNVPPPGHIPPPAHSFDLANAHLRQFLGNPAAPVSAASLHGFDHHQSLPSASALCDEVNVDSTDSESEQSEDTQDGFPFAKQTEAPSRPSFGCGLFVKDHSGAETDVSAAAGAGTCWALNEICRLLAKQRSKYCVFGGPQVRQIDSFHPMNGKTTSTSNNFSGIASFCILNSLLYADQD